MPLENVVPRRSRMAACGGLLFVFRRDSSRSTLNLKGEHEGLLYEGFSDTVELYHRPRLRRTSHAPCELQCNFRDFAAGHRKQKNIWMISGSTGYQRSVQGRN